MYCGKDVTLKEYNGNKNVVIRARVSEELAIDLEHFARLRHESMSDYLRHCIEKQMKSDAAYYKKHAAPKEFYTSPYEKDFNYADDFEKEVLCENS